MNKSTRSVHATLTTVLFSTLPLFSFAQTEKACNFQGHIIGVESDTLISLGYDLNTSERLFTDTIAMEDGVFKTRIEQNVPMTIVLSPLISQSGKSGKAAMAAVSLATEKIIFLPGDNMAVNGEINRFSISGTQLYDQLNGIAALKEIEKERRGLFDESSALYAKGRKPTQEELDAIRKKFEDCAGKEAGIIIDYIKANPGNIASGYLATRLPLEKGVEAVALLGDNVKQGHLKSMILRIEKAYNDRKAKEIAKTKMQKGMPAPDFKLKNLEGKVMSPADFKGKYLLLDFWGTWCGWCIKGIPDMKKYYAKYSSKIEFVGVDCGDTEAKWRQGVKEHGLPWTNLYADKASTITNDYAISGFPTKILIDPEGKLVEIFVGESPELYNRLDSLFGK